MDISHIFGGMKTLVVSGSRSKAGKTRLAEILLGLLPGFSAIKVTLNDTYTAVSDDERDIMAEGKDTCRMARAGAEKVIWVRTTEEDIEETMSLAAGLLPPGCEGVVIEGNYVLSRLSPDLCFFVTDGEIDEMKPSRVTALKKADIVILNLRQEKSDPEVEAGIPGALETINPTARFLAMDLLNPDMAIIQKLLNDFL